jgi:hypothetical protein
MRLEVAIGAGDVSDFDGEEDVAAVVGPVEFSFLRAWLWVRRRGAWAGLFALAALPGAGAALPRLESSDVDFDVFEFFLALVDGVGEEG